MEGHEKAPGISWKGSGVGGGARSRAGRVRAPAARLRLAGLAAQPVEDQPLAERPQGPRRLLALSLGGGQAAAAVVEVHPSQALQLRSSGAVDGGGSSLLLEIKGKKHKDVFKR